MKKRKSDCPGGSAWQLFLNNHTVTVRALPVHGYAGMDCDAAGKALARAEEHRMVAKTAENEWFRKNATGTAGNMEVNLIEEK